MATVSFQNIEKSFGTHQGHPRHQLRHHGRRVHGAGRAVGLRQVDAAAHARRPRGDHRRHDRDRRQGGQRRRVEGPRHRDGVPELRALPAHDGRRQHGVQPEAAQGRSEDDGRARRACVEDPEPRSVPARAFRASSPAASGSASRWAARSSAIRRCSCSTSRCRTSTPSCASRCAPRSRRCISGSRRRPSTSRTTRSRR